MPRVTLVLVSSHGFRPRSKQGQRSRVPSWSSAACDLRETTVSMVLDLECRGNLTCPVRKELFPVRSVHRNRSQELHLVISFKSEFTKKVSERALAITES